MMRLMTLMILLFGSPVLAAKAVDFDLGDLTEGRALMKAHCGGCDAVNVHDPMALALVGEAMVRKGLATGKGVGPLTGWDGTRLHELQAWDVIRYLRRYSISIADLMPTATHYSIEDATPNEWGRDRLFRKAKVFKAEPTEKQVTGKVIVLWEDLKARGLSNVTGDTSIIGGFEREQKSNFVLLRTVTVAKRKIHLGLALDSQTLKVVSARAVYADGSDPSAALRAVRSSCKGKGRRDNYRRFSCGRTGRLARPLWDAYIVGVEQVYAYEIVVRENDFGADLDTSEEDSESSTD